MKSEVETFELSGTLKEITALIEKFSVEVSTKIKNADKEIPEDKIKSTFESLKYDFIGINHIQNVILTFNDDILSAVKKLYVLYRNTTGKDDEDNLDSDNENLDNMGIKQELIKTVPKSEPEKVIVIEQEVKVVKKKSTKNTKKEAEPEKAVVPESEKAVVPESEKAVVPEPEKAVVQESKVVKKKSVKNSKTKLDAETVVAETVVAETVVAETVVAETVVAESVVNNDENTKTKTKKIVKKKLEKVVEDIQAQENTAIVETVKKTKKNKKE
jgi:hypothetical protein